MTIKIKLTQERVWLDDFTVFTHHDLDHSKNHYIVLPEQLAKVYQHTPFFVTGSLAKHRYGKFYFSCQSRPEPCQGHAPLPYPEAFILPSRNIIPIRFFSYQKFCVFLCKYCDLLHAKQLNRIALFSSVRVSALTLFVLLLLRISP